MDDLSLEALGFDFRGPASSEALNQFVTQMNRDIGGLMGSASLAKAQTEMLANQTLKQTYAFCRKVAEDDDRDTGSICSADLSDTTAVLTTDIDGVLIDPSSRFSHRHQNQVITPTTTSVSWLTRYDGDSRQAALGVVTAEESVTESGGTLYSIPATQAISGLPAIYYERIYVVSTVSGAKEASVFYSIPPSLTGEGYPKSNYLAFMPFPIYTESVRVYNCLTASPTLTRAGSTWNNWPSYCTSLYNGAGNVTWHTKSGPVFSSFPSSEITAIRIDMQQPYFLVESSDYVFSYGIGELEVGMMKPISGLAKGTVRIDKPTGSFVTLTDDDIVFDNLSASDISDAVTTQRKIDEGDASIAYVEITIDMDSISSDIIPIITSVSVDYTGT